MLIVYIVIECLDSDVVHRGYKDNPVATADTMLEGGWYRTGDLGYIDDNGFLVVYDRLKDIIKYNGFVSSSPLFPPSSAESTCADARGCG